MEHDKAEQPSFFKVGAIVMVHGCNDDYVGKIEQILPGRVLRLSSASWVSESGRLSQFVATGAAEGMEIEPVGNHIMTWEGVTEWPHKLFTKAV